MEAMRGRIQEDIYVASDNTSVLAFSLRIHVRDVVPWVAVQRLLQAFLINVMPDKADRAPQHEEPVQHPKLDEFVGLFSRESSTITQQVDKAHGDASIHIEDKG